MKPVELEVIELKVGVKAGSNAIDDPVIEADPVSEDPILVVLIVTVAEVPGIKSVTLTNPELLILALSISSIGEILACQL